MVLFVDSNDYSVVPVNWLVNVTNIEETIQLNPSSIKYCQWPSCKVTSTELLTADDPDQTWKSYKIKILTIQYMVPIIFLFILIFFIICCS